MFKFSKCKLALILSVVIAACATITVFSVSADEVSPSLTVGSGEFEVGGSEEITIDVKVKNFSKVVGIQLYVNYGKLEFVNVTSNCITLGDGSYSYDNTTGSFALAELGNHTQGNNYVSGFATTDNETTLLSFTFRKPSSASAGQQFDIAVLEKSLFCNNNEEILTVTTTNGKITVKAPYVLGDINNDGRINTRDAVALSSYTARTTTDYDQMIESNLNACDINGDGRINARDAVALSGYTARTTTDYDHYFN